MSLGFFFFNLFRIFTFLYFWACGGDLKLISLSVENLVIIEAFHLISSSFSFPFLCFALVWFLPWLTRKGENLVSTTKRAESLFYSWISKLPQQSSILKEKCEHTGKCCLNHCTCSICFSTSNLWVCNSQAGQLCYRLWLERAEDSERIVCPLILSFSILITLLNISYDAPTTNLPSYSLSIWFTKVFCFVFSVGIYDINAIKIYLMSTSFINWLCYLLLLY